VIGGIMKILGVNVVYDEKETLKAREDYKNELPVGMLRKLRVYEVTDEFDNFRKYRFAFGLLDILRIHIQKVWDYWVFRRRRYANVKSAVKKHQEVSNA
jgi:hypothetical protein